MKAEKPFKFRFSLDVVSELGACLDLDPGSFLP